MNFNAIVAILIPFTVISAGENDIKISETNSWISKENFSTIINDSYDRARCVNVFVLGDSVATEALFTNFINIYQYGYMTVNRSVTCNGYFMISQTADEKLFPKLTKLPLKSSSEILIIVDENLTESSSILNVSIYDYANVNIVTKNGFWKLSENFLTPRIFKKYSRYDEKLRKRGFANLQGRQLKAAAHYKPPFCYLKSTINRTVDGVDTELFVTTNTSELDGVEVKLFLLMAEALNFTWTIRKSNVTYRGHIQDGVIWDRATIGHVHEKEVDMAFSNIWIDLNKSLVVNLTRPWTEGAVNFLVPRPKHRHSFGAIIKPFSSQLWLAIIMMMIAQSIYVCVKAWTIPRVPRRFRNFIVTFTELMGLLLGVWSPKKIRGLKIQLQLWQYIGVLLVTSYSTNLAARLTSFKYDKRINNLEDFVSADLIWGREAMPIFSTYFDQTDRYGKLMSQYFRLETNESDRHEKILKGNYAIFGKVIGKMFFPDSDIRREDLKDYRVMERKTTQFYVAFVAQPWLLEPIDKVILRLREAGLAGYHLDHVISRHTGNEYREIFVERDNELSSEPRVLTLFPLGAAYLILFIGVTLSFVIFCIELKHASKKKSIIHTLRLIKRKRDVWHSRRNITKPRYPILKSFRGPKYGFPLP